VERYGGEADAELILAVAGGIGGALVNGVNAYSTGGDVWRGAAVGFVSGFVAGFIGNPFLAGALAVGANHVPK
jgi:hypothetical protein